MTIPTPNQLSQTNRRLYAIIGHVFSWVLILLSVGLYQERLNNDAAYYITKVINEEGFHVELGRLVLALSQILPLLALKLGLSLKAILLAYSLNAPLYFYGFFVLFMHGFKKPGLAIAVVISQLVGVSFGYFTPMFELYYSVPWVFLCYMLLSQVGNPKRYAIFLVSAIFAVTAHMNGILLLLFLVALDFAQYRKYRWAHWCVLFLVLIGASIYKSMYPSEYESQKLAYAFDFSKNLNYQNLFDVHYLWALVRFLLKHYWEAIAIFSIPIIGLIIARRWLELGLVIAVFAGNVILIQVMYYGLDMTRYMNQVYFPLTVIAAVAFTYRLSSLPSYLQKTFAAIMVVLLLFRVNAIVDLSKRFTGDVTEMRHMIERGREMGGSKFQTRYNNLVHDEAVAGQWSLPIQTMLHSALEGPENAVTIHWDYEVSRMDVNDNEHYFRMNEIVTDTSINQRYFQLQPGLYQLLQKNLPNPEDEIASWGKLLWGLKTEPKQTLPSNQLTALPLQLDVLPSDTVYVDADNQIFFAYHWYQNGKEVTWNGIRTAVEVDITNAYQQRLMIETPKKRGNYTLEVDLVHEGVKWFGQSKSYDITIY